jgi:integrase
LPSYLADVTLFTFYSAWRRGEILSFTWNDLIGDEIHLPPEHSKNGSGRTLVLAGELANIIERRQKLMKG